MLITFNKHERLNSLSRSFFHAFSFWDLFIWGTAYDFSSYLNFFFPLSRLLSSPINQPLHLRMSKYKTKHIAKDEVVLLYVQVLESA